MEYRIEKDTMGEVKVPAKAYYGAQTQRSIDNFRIAQDINRMPKEIIQAFAYLKKAAATLDQELLFGHFTTTGPQSDVDLARDLTDRCLRLLGVTSAPTMAAAG